MPVSPQTSERIREWVCARDGSVYVGTDSDFVTLPFNEGQAENACQTIRDQLATLVEAELFDRLYQALPTIPPSLPPERLEEIKNRAFMPPFSADLLHALAHVSAWAVRLANDSDARLDGLAQGQRERDALAKHNQDLRDLLKEIEWSATPGSRTFDGCPWCTGERATGHDRDCEFAIALQRDVL